jgi:hypothetical protein
VKARSLCTVLRGGARPRGSHHQTVVPAMAWLSLAMFGALVMPQAPAFADDQSACIQRSVIFDGIAPLRYARLIGNSGERLYLHSDYPSTCATQTAATCKADAYLAPGDMVAIGKSCGAWNYVQYIGTDHLRTGWIAASGVEAQAERPISGFKPGHQFPRPTGYHFKLTRGQGVPVCEAYLQRLNVSHFEKPPYCGRPENASVPGFATLVRIPLETSEVNKLYRHAYNFFFPKLRPYEQPGIADIRQGRLDVTGAVGHDLAAWRYQPAVDLDNDGAPDNIIVWHALSPSGGATRCAEDFSSVGIGLRAVQAPLIFKADDTGIDQGATEAIIGHPVQRYDLTLDTGNLYVDASTFRTIARAIGIFRYRDTYYFDGFFDIWGDADDKRRGEPKLANTLGVFARKANVTRQICEYQMSGADYPTP